MFKQQTSYLVKTSCGSTIHRTDSLGDAKSFVAEMEERLCEELEIATIKWRKKIYVPKFEPKPLLYLHNQNTNFKIVFIPTTIALPLSISAGFHRGTGIEGAWILVQILWFMIELDHYPPPF